jgi:hypothetical protein
MAEKRAEKRTRRRLLVDFETGAAKTTGFTSDVSPDGLFVRTIRIPRIGERLRAVVHLPDGRLVELQGVVVRSYRAPPVLRSLVPTGFAMRLRLARPREYVDYASGRP